MTIRVVSIGALLLAFFCAAAGCGSGTQTATSEGSGGASNSSGSKGSGSQSSGSHSSGSHSGGGGSASNGTAAGGGGSASNGTAAGGGGSASNGTATGGGGSASNGTATGGGGSASNGTATGGGNSASGTASGASTTTSTGTAGGCQTDADCDDSVTCTVDSCDPVTHTCVHSKDDAKCDDNLFCTGQEVCDPPNGASGSGCVSRGNPCDDGIPCTLDTCDEAAKSCTHTPQDSQCDDGIACNGPETCSPTLGCVSGTPINCDDGIACTDDFCDSTTGQCRHVPQDLKCPGDFCSGFGTCDPSSGCLAGTPANCDDGVGCTVDSCDAPSGKCVHTPTDSLCDDNLFCNGQETCDAVAGCVPGSPIVCDDGFSCTVDTCSEVTKGCVFTPNDNACNDGLFCNGVETCVGAAGAAGTGCKAGTPVPCASDGVACTVDACSETTKKCEHTPDNTLCPAGAPICSPPGGCTNKPCNTSAQCQDGDLCNGVETCVNGACKPGTPVDCDDGIDCTVDSCTKATGACVHTPTDSICDDGFACNGKETCDAQNGCVSSAPIDCDDGVACTIDSCSEPNGTCVHTPDHTACDDGQLCNGQEICTATGCKPGAPFVCPDDGISCTTEVCDPTFNVCRSVPNDNLCPPLQSCVPSLGGCGNYCKVSTCQGKVYACGDCVDNDGDGRIDASDSQCLGPCDNTEDSLYIGIPGANNSPCKMDCYFDADTGAGNDGCYWSHKCDPIEQSSGGKYPEDSCSYNPNAKIPGYTNNTGLSDCAATMLSQSTQCKNYCGPLTPNGCDCFGCCTIPGAPTPVYLGSENPKGTPSCTIANIADPTKCHPCTQVTSCLNTCDHCELCVGKTVLPADCQSQVCPAGQQLCGLPGQAPCASGLTCITGCCQSNPQ